MRRALPRLLLAAVALLYASPLLLMVSGSLRGRGLPPPRGVEILPGSPTLDAYATIAEVLPLATYGRNSLVVAALAVPLTVLVGSLAGFGIRLLPPRATRWALAATVGALLVPVTAVWATRFELFRLAGAVDTFVPLVGLALVATSPFLVLVYAFAFWQLPDEQLEAAALDGAGPLRLWWSIGLPQARAATLAVVVLAFTFHWSNFIDPLLYLNRQSLFTAPLGLRLLQQLNPTDWPLLMAGAVLTTLPPVAVFLLGQRAFLGDEGLLATAGRWRR
ncbi:MAG: carbohydrate ABC transporter permease [Actinobacteria bacterium]|nr:carbohydrate ABC transporter permease [Actinomycetota bacterium]